MTDKIVWIAVLLLCCLSACKHPDNKGIKTKDHKNLYGRQIALPDSGKWFVMGRDTSVFLSNKTKIVAYYGPEGCVPCKLKELSGWKHLINEIRSNPGPGSEVDFVFIMSPGREGGAGLHEIIRELNFDFPVLCDFDGSFEKSNLLADNELYNTFLLDEINKAVVVGSPLYNKTLWAFYKEKIVALNNRSQGIKTPA